MKGFLSILLLVPGFGLFPAFGPSPGRENLGEKALAAFPLVEKRFPGKEWIARQTGAGLAWGESYRLMAYVSMFEGTGREEYLEKALERMKRVLSIRDDKRKIRDEIRGRVIPAWSSQRYTKGKNYAWIVHAGMITYPMARLAYLVKKDAKLRGKHGKRVESILRDVEETVRAFDPDWRERSSGGEGWYYCDFLKRKLPLNMQNAMGRVLVALWSATRKRDYREKAGKLARFFKRRLRPKGEAWVWPYWPEDKKGVEDVSHGAINVDFAFCCYRAGIVFARKDMLRFAGTFRICLRPGKGFARRVDGRGDLKYSSAMAGWGHLGFLAPWVRKALFDFFRNRWPSSALAAPYLVETGRPFQREDPVERLSSGKKGNPPR